MGEGESGKEVTKHVGGTAEAECDPLPGSVRDATLAW